MLEIIQMKKYYRVLFIIVFFLFIYHEFIGLKKLAGYCEEKNAYFSELYTDNVLIDKAINFLIKDLPHIVSTGEGKKIYVEPYLSVEEFKNLNPNCCNVQRSAEEGFMQSIFIRKTGEAYAYVKLIYTLRYKEKDIEPDQWTEYVEINTCGNMRYPDQTSW